MLLGASWEPPWPVSFFISFVAMSFGKRWFFLIHVLKLTGNETLDYLSRPPSLNVGVWGTYLVFRCSALSVCSPRMCPALTSVAGGVILHALMFLHVLDYCSWICPNQFSLCSSLSPSNRGKRSSAIRSDLLSSPLNSFCTYIEPGSLYSKQTVKYIHVQKRLRSRFNTANKTNQTM